MARRGIRINYTDASTGLTVTNAFVIVREVNFNLFKRTAIVEIDIYASNAQFRNGKAKLATDTLVFTQEVDSPTARGVSESVTFGQAFGSLIRSGSDPAQSLLDRIYAYLMSGRYSGGTQLNSSSD